MNDAADDTSADAYALFRRAEARLQDGDPDTAASLAEQVLESGVGSASVYELLGRARFARGDHLAAAEAFEDLTSLEPTNAYAHFGVGRALEQLGMLGQARRHLRLATALSSRHLYHRHLRRLEARMAA